MEETGRDETVLKEKELRIALVCYGGVSLAVYMHGVTKELLKLARASRVFHAIKDPARRATLDYDQALDLTGIGRLWRERRDDTEALYFDLLRQVGGALDLRVVIDVIAGSSAGGINGVLLARALAHDLDLDALTDLWLEGADVTELMEETGRAGTWSKWFLKPFLAVGLKSLRTLTPGLAPGLAPDLEIRSKLSMFLRSRWFKPPFDGDRLMGMLLDAAARMGTSGQANNGDGPSLLPAGQTLSLFVTVTDFHGHLQQLPAHDPPVVEEREHRHILAFHYRRQAGAADGQAGRASGAAVSDFDDDAVPGLVFAARASSSFPGAFPPAQIRDLDRLLAARGAAWPARERFLAGNFAAYTAIGEDPVRASFIDGSVLNNKPFAQALEAIAGRPAYREVDRRLVYIDPDPAHLRRQASRAAPGFFRTLKGALSDIPRNEPIRDEVAAIDQDNARVRQLSLVIAAARPRVIGLVLDVVGGEPPEEMTYGQIHDWRERANARAAREAGFAYEAYVRLKLTTALDQLGRRVAGFCRYSANGAAARQVTARIHDWARAQAVIPDEVTGWSLDQPGDGPPPWVRFLLDFDVGFRIRRLRFVIRALNDLYTRLDDPLLAGVRTRDLDEIKAGLYDRLDSLRRFETGEHLTPSEREAIAAVFIEPLAMGRPPDMAEMDTALRRLAHGMDLASVNRQVDEIFALMGLNLLGAAARRELFVAYVGFAFWDVLTFSLSGWRELYETNEIKVDRISPDDARLCRRLVGDDPLRGRALNHFAAFFSRKDRENDYLLGRLHAAERLVDLVRDAAGIAPASQDGETLKRRLFAAIARAEESRLGHNDGDGGGALRALRRAVDGGA